MEALLKKIDTHHNQNLPFVLYAFPESDTVTALFQQTDTRYISTNLSEKGFVFTPFAEGATLLIPENESEIVSIPFSEQTDQQERVDFAITPSEKIAYQTLVKEAIEFINNEKATKVVTSRRKKIEIPRLNLPEVIRRLFTLYPNAFRYVWYHPTTGIWCGASPEILLETKGMEFYTMALAGTKKQIENKEPHWTYKEIEEQQWVKEAIATELHTMASIVKASKRKNHKAGTLVHLRTDFVGVFKKKGNNLAILSKMLHPTPAVCGTPKKVAKDFILKYENYPREYYTGFLGPINYQASNSQLFVNLRCMKIYTDTAYLYVGGGITQTSEPQAEWEETCDKLQTMLQVLAPMLYN